VGGWYIWWQRRELVKGESVSPPKPAFAIKAITANYAAAKKNSVEKEIKGQKPNRGNLKVNIDASYYPNGSGAVGGVLRDSKGDVRGGAVSLLIICLARR
jgi:hypothetical protein